MKVLLHVGCGSSDIRHLPAFFQDGCWEELRYDINEAVEPDFVGILQDMSMIEDESIDALYSSHNIEHVWSFEVPKVLAEFTRVLKPDGFAVVLCPDILSVAQAITKGFLGQPLYTSPAGPISAIDIMYGFQHDIEKGNLFMAHKTAFTAQTLASALAGGGFAGSVVARDRGFGLYAVATKSAWDEVSIKRLIDVLHPANEYVLERMRFGCYTPSV
jgi:SAM-dependent methyltransferase